MRLRTKSLLSGDPLAAVAPLVAFILALAVGGLMILALGKNPIEAYGAMLDGAFGSLPSILRTLTRATPLMLVAIGICIAFRGGVVNIGAEGQLFVGAISATAFSLAVGEILPSWLFIPLALVVGFAAGALWGGVAGFLKARFHVNEILSTVMMNEIAIQLVIFLRSGPMLDPKEIEQGTRVPQTAQLPESVWLPRLTDTAKDIAQRLGIEADIQTSQVHTGLFVAIALAVIVYILLWRTTIGYRIRAVGQNRDAAKYAGIAVPTYLLLSLVLSGGLAGIAGTVEVIGVTHRVVRGSPLGMVSPALWWRYLGDCIRWAQFLQRFSLVRSSSAQTRCSAACKSRRQRLSRWRDWSCCSSSAAICGCGDGRREDRSAVHRLRLLRWPNLPRQPRERR